MAKSKMAKSQMAKSQMKLSQLPQLSSVPVAAIETDNGAILTGQGEIIGNITDLGGELQRAKMMIFSGQTSINNIAILDG